MIITGSTSMIGSRFLELSKDDFSNEKKLLLDSKNLDLISASQNDIEKTFSGFENHNLLHFAAYTDVDGAEAEQGDQKGNCWQLNVEGTKKLSNVAKKLNLKMVYISTDFVFNGREGPYGESDPVAQSVSDISWYGWTKLEGEKIVQNSKVPFLIARTSYPYGAKFAPKTDFVRNIIERFKTGNLYPQFTDQFLTPTFIDDLVKALDLLISENQTGIWHIADNTTLSPYEAAVEIAKVFGANPAKIQKTSITKFQSENPAAAKRPIKGGLKNAKLRKFLRTAAQNGFDMQDFGQVLIEIKKQMGVSS